MNFLQFAFVCWKAWKQLKRVGISYSTAIDRYGVPRMALFVAWDREAWRVVQYAVESHLARGTQPLSPVLGNYIHELL